MENEVKSWPYKFPASADFEKAQIRGSVSGRLMVQDWWVFNLICNNIYAPMSQTYDDFCHFNINSKIEFLRNLFLYPYVSF